MCRKIRSDCSFTISNQFLIFRRELKNNVEDDILSIEFSLYYIRVNNVYEEQFKEVVFVENLLYIAAIVAAIAFLILCISLAMTLFSLKNTLKSVSETMGGLTTQLEGVTTETTELLHKTNDLAEDILLKAEKLNSVVDAVKGVGDSVTGLNSSVRRVSDSITTGAEQNGDKIAQVVQWSNVVMGIMSKVKERKTGNSNGWTIYNPQSGKNK